MSRAKYEVIEIDHAEITVDVSMLTSTGDLFFNATNIASRFGKRPDDWLRLKASKEYISVVLDEFNYGNSRNKNSDLVQIRRGKYGGTYLHRELAMEFAGWCSALFRRKLHKYAMERIEQEHDRRRSRLEAKTDFLPLTEAVQAAHDEPKGYHYSNEIRLLCKLVTGYQPKQFKKLHDVKNARDGMDAAQLAELRELEALNTALINRGMPYKDRKRWLTEQHDIEAAA